MLFLRVILPLAAAVCLAAAAPSAQVVVVGGGCTVPAGGTPGIVEPEAGGPRLGNLDFSLSYTCPYPSKAAFVVYGGCEASELPVAFAPSPCGIACGRAVDLGSAVIVGFAILEDGAPTVLRLGIPDFPTLGGVTLCVQFVCVELGPDPPRCYEISQGSSVRFNTSEPSPTSLERADSGSHAKASTDPTLSRGVDAHSSRDRSPVRPAARSRQGPRPLRARR